MSTALVKREAPKGFTLLEIVLAVAILGMMSLAIYRFVQSSVLALRVSSETAEADSRYNGFVNLLTAQWQSLPGGQGALKGEPIKLDNRSRDEVTWICGAGPGLLTRYADGDFVVSLRLRPESKTSDRLSLGFVRKPKEDAAVSVDRETWVPLLENVQSLQIRYFDPRLNAWVDKWTDSLTLPRLVRLVIGRPDNSAPFDAVIALGRTPL